VFAGVWNGRNAGFMGDFGSVVAIVVATSKVVATR
jgi:hypothetical protein